MLNSFGKKGLKVIIIIIVCVAVAVTHWPALSAKALAADDSEYLTKNLLVQNPNWSSAKRFFTEVLKPSTVKGYYQPLAMISLMLDCAAGGTENNFRPFHITSLTLHIANTVLIILLLYLLFGNIWAAAAAGLIFGIHPINIEPIPWIAERKTLLAAFFSFWSLIFYVRFTKKQSGSWKSYLGCFLMYLFALLSKPTSVPLPIMMLLMDYWPLNRLRIKCIIEKIPLIILSFIFVIIIYFSQNLTAGAEIPLKSDILKIILVICHNIIFYIHKIIIPSNVFSLYNFPAPFDLSNPAILSGLLGTCILIPLLFLSLRWTRAALTGWLIFFVAIFPAMGVIGFTDVIAADRFVYLPFIGLLMVLTSFLVWISKIKFKIVIIILLLIIAGTEALTVQKYLRYWQDTISLCDYMLSLTPDSATLYNERGIAFNNKGQLDFAITDYNKTIEIKPEFAAAYNNRGAAYYDKGNFELAIEDYNKAIEMKPEFIEVYNNRGSVYYAKGQLEQAISDFNKAIEMNPRYTEAYNNRGTAYSDKGQLDNAISDYNRSIEINPKYAKAYNNRGNIYAEKGEFKLAICDYNKAIEINPTLFEAFINKAGACENAGLKKEAVDAYKTFIQYAPNSYAPHIEHARQRLLELK